MLGAVVTKHSMAWRAIDYEVHEQNRFNCTIVKRIGEVYSKSVVTNYIFQKRKILDRSLRYRVWVAPGITKPVENRSSFSLTVRPITIF
jgi:hypothetical protein